MTTGRATFTVVLVWVGIFSAAESRAATFQLRSQRFALSLPKDWVSVLPNENNLILQGPETAGQPRSVVFVSFTDIRGAQFNPAGMQVHIDSYTEGRRKYITAKGGELIRFIPYAVRRGPDAVEVHTTGVDFRIGQEIHHERTGFISCHGSVFHVKTLDLGNPELKNSAAAIGKTFQCAH